MRTTSSLGSREIGGILQRGWPTQCLRYVSHAIPERKDKPMTTRSLTIVRFACLTIATLLLAPSAAVAGPAGHDE